MGQEGLPRAAVESPEFRRNYDAGPGCEGTGMHLFGVLGACDAPVDGDLG
jgi:hypothetical protein